MSEEQKMGKTAESAGNLLSSIAPPSVLPNFVTSSVPMGPPQQPDSMAPLPQLAQIPPTPLFPVQPPLAPAAIPDHFSPAIPPSKGEPTVAIRSPEDSETTTQSPVSLPPSTPDRELIGDPMPGSGLLTWVKGAVSTGGTAWFHRVAEKAKSSVDSMITTLDPQMKEYLNSGGDIQIVVTSDKEWDVSPIREAFQAVFGKATVIGVACDIGGQATAPQLVGARAAYAAAKHRLAQLRAADPQLHNNVPLLAVESYIDELPGDKWFEVNLLVLSQPSLGVELAATSQSASVPAPVVAALRAATPPDYPLADSGLAVTAASVMAQSLQVAQWEWQEAVSGVPRRSVLLLAARSLAGGYKRLLEMSATAPTT